MSEPLADPPAEVTAWAAERAAARERRDFAAADELRQTIAAAGWQVTDTSSGWSLAPAPPYPVLPALADLPDRTEQPPSHQASIGVLVEGWPQDVDQCLSALLAHTPPDVQVLALDLGNVDGAGDALHRWTTQVPDRVHAWHLAGTTGWAAARTALLRLDTAEIHVWLDLSTLFTGDALSPVLAAFADPDVVGAGWQGANVDLADQWRSFVPVPAGEVDALLGYLFAMRRDAALAAGGPDPKARFYRNADLEFSFMLREASGGRLVVPQGPLPLRQGRHRGYYDSDPAYRDRESRRTYDRFLRRYRNRSELLAPRGG